MASDYAFIFGRGGHAHVIASLLGKSAKFVVNEVKSNEEMLEREFFEQIESFRKQNIYIGIGNNDIRKRIFNRLCEFDLKISICIAPTAFVASDAHISEGAVLCPGSVVNSQSFIGANTIINTLSSVDHDCKLGDHTQVTAGVTIGGTVSVGLNCFFGIKSSVIPNLSIGNNVQVMAGALITKSIPNSVMVGGSPARIIKNI